MTNINVEICIEASGRDAVRDAVRAAYDGGAATVELCAAMHLDGLTPEMDLVEVARRAFDDRRGLMVMIRPRAGDFVYTAAELALMKRQIASAADAGADGVVFGVLRVADSRVDVDAMTSLIAVACKHGLATTFHRAFDATPSLAASLDAALALGCQRVLTSGIPWGRPGSALDGAWTLAQLVRRANGRLEILIGGGVNPNNVGAILKQIPGNSHPLGVHAYSGAQEYGRVTVGSVRRLVDAS